MIESKHSGDVITLPSHTLAMADFESGLRAHWTLMKALMVLGLLTDKLTIKLGIGVKARSPDRNILYRTAFGRTRAEVMAFSQGEMIAALDKTGDMKSGYAFPAEGPVPLREAVVHRYARRFGVPDLTIDRVLYAPGGCSQGLDDVIGNLFDKDGVVPTDIPCWPGLPPKVVRHGAKPVGMLRCHESFDNNRHHLAPLIDRGIAGVYTSFPGNPIGLRLTPERLDVLTRTRLWLRDRCVGAGRRPPIWISDAVYMDQPGETLSMLAGEDPAEVVEVFSLTKGRLMAGSRDHFQIVGTSTTLNHYVAQQARDNLSGNVTWHYVAALTAAIEDADGFLAHERELDEAAGQVFEATIAGVPGLSIDPAVDDQYRYVHLTLPEDGPNSEDWKRWSMLYAAATGGTWTDWVPGLYFNHPVILREMGIRLHEVDGIRTIMAYPPDVMQRAGQNIVETWQRWSGEGFTVVPKWDDLVTLVNNGVSPRQILDASRAGEATSLIARVKAEIEAAQRAPDDGIKAQDYRPTASA